MFASTLSKSSLALNIEEVAVVEVVVLEVVGEVVIVIGCGGFTLGERHSSGQ
jgi:hypothetical protein